MRYKNKNLFSHDVLVPHTFGSIPGFVLRKKKKKALPLASAALLRPSLCLVLRREISQSSISEGLLKEQ
jgi:hypothetical protein